MIPRKKRFCQSVLKKR
ncbi:MAG: hypothetical protein E7584_01560 [Ruminococcaceae bacterium]|nr:hypothetical protein [Oscillospiraceae bacterium]